MSEDGNRQNLPLELSEEEIEMVRQVRSNPVLAEKLGSLLHPAV